MGSLCLRSGMRLSLRVFSALPGGEQDARPGWVFQEKAAPPPAEKLAPGERLQPSKQQLAEHARRETEAGFTAAGDEDALGRSG